MIMGAIYSSKRYYTTRYLLLEQQQQQQRDENEQENENIKIKSSSHHYQDIFSIFPFIGVTFTVSTLTGIVCYIIGGWW